MPRVSLVGDGHGGLEDYATLVLWWASEGSINYGSQIEALCLGDVGGNTTFSGNPPFGAVIHTDSILYDGSNQSSLASCTGSITINGNNITVSDMLINGLAGVLGNNALLTRSRVLGGINYNSSGTAGKLVSFCVISRPSSFVITYGGGDQGDVENCLIFGTTGTGIITGGGGGQNLKNNFSFNNGGNDYQGATDSFITNASEDSTGTAGLTGFTSSELVDFANDDFRTKSTSTLATAGTTTAYIGAFLEASQGVTVTATLGAIVYASKNAVISLAGAIDVSTTLGAISYSSNSSVISLTGSVDVPATLGLIDYASQGTTVSLAGIVDVTPTLGSINYSSQNTTVSVTGDVDIAVTLGAIYYTSNNTTIGLTGETVISATIGAIDYSSQGASVLLSGLIDVNTTLGAIVYNSYNVSVSIGDGQLIDNVTSSFKNDIYSSGFKPNTITVNFK